MTDGDRFGDLDEPLAEDRQESGASAPTVEPPRVQRPTAEVPEPSATSTGTAELQARAADVDPEFKVLFWKLVLLYKLGVVGLTIGILLWVFGSHPTRGPALAVGGAVLVLYAVVLTRRGKARLDAGEFDLDGDESGEEPSQ